ncbi:porin family protein [Mangrovimonas spongiae]|uniref:Porin family protein n=1 Tax=Mangrovimonas spongiae TaxID=2494697 RepID=A0A428JWK4_9FLAO|nr:porin family protein [Mangrovimonas spongiae]RSK38533.1 porin family protein [Mangrovimonas spongiae]
MKKIIFLVFVIACTTVSFSQKDLYGVRVGYNISNLDFDPDANFSNQHRNGFAIGFFGEYALTTSMSIAPEIQFSAEGAKDRDLRIDYIQTPILLKFRLGDRFSIGAGPLVGVKIHEYEDGYKNFAFSGIGGLEFMITDEIFIDARYHYGLTNIIDDENDIEAKNTNIQLGIGIKI